MTIAAAYLTSEGIVLGADSTTTVTIPSGGVVQLFDHAQKIYEIGEGTSFALCTWGAGMVGPLSHRSVAALTGDKIDETKSVKDVVDAVCDVVSPHLGSLPADNGFGYFVGGIDPQTRAPRCFRVLFGSQGPQIEPELAIGEARFEGAPHYFSRVFVGFEPDLPHKLLEALKRRLPDVDGLDNAFEEACNEVLPAYASIGSTDIPIREAIDYVHTYLAITIKAFKFRYGPPPCGGETEIGFVTTDRKFRWAAHKPFLSAVLENNVRV